MRAFALVALLLLSPLAWGAPAATEGPWGAWRTETVYQPYYSSIFIGPTMVLDEKGYPHIVHGNQFQPNHLAAAYHYYDGLRWHSENIHEVGRATGLALDAQGRPHVALAGNGFDERLMYATKDAQGAWMVEDAGVSGAVDPHLWLDSEETPHIVYHWAGHGFAYATRGADGSWTNRLVDPRLGNVRLDLEVDSQGDPHVAYMVGYTVQYATMDTNGTWAYELAAASCGGDVGLGLDPQDRPHITCSDNGLQYHHHDGTQWVHETVRAGSKHGKESDVAVDAQGRVHIVYGAGQPHGDRISRTLGAAHLHYVVKLETGWFFEKVDPVGELTGLYPSLKLDDEGRPRIAYVLGWWRDGEGESHTNHKYDLMYAEPAITALLNPLGQ